MMDARISLEDFSDQDLIDLVQELRGDSFAEDSLIRKLAKYHFGTDSLTSIMGISHIILLEMSKRFKVYSPHIN